MEHREKHDLKIDIKSETLRAQNFMKLCEAALKEDGTYSRRDRSLIRRIYRINRKYISELKKMLGPEDE